MPLTAADVRSTTFATTRFHAGYNMDEVDEFLDVVEADVAQFADELQRSRDGEAVLRAQCDQLQLRVTIAEQKVADAEAEVAVLRAREPMVPIVPIEPSAQAMEAMEGNDEALAIVALAQRTADEMVRTAQAQVTSIKAAMRSTLDQQRALLDANG